MTTLHKIIIFLFLLLFCSFNTQAVTTHLQSRWISLRLCLGYWWPTEEQTHSETPISSHLNPSFAPAETSTPTFTNQLSTRILIPRPNYWLSALTYLQCQAHALLAKYPLTNLSKWVPENCPTGVKSALALAFTTARRTCVTVITPITITTRKWMDVFTKNYRYLQAAMEDERRLIQIQKDLEMMSAVGTSSNETSLAIVPTRQQAISAVAALAGIDPQDVLPIVLQLESAARGIQRFTQVKIPSHVRVLTQLSQRIASREWMRALYTWIKTRIIISTFAIGVLTACLCVLVDNGIARLVKRGLVLVLVYFSWRYLVKEE